MYKIDKNYAIPPLMRSKFPFREMKVGDSFFVPKKEKVPTSNVRCAAESWKKSHPGFTYASRTVEGGLRVWRKT